MHKSIGHIAGVLWNKLSVKIKEGNDIRTFTNDTCFTSI